MTSKKENQILFFEKESPMRRLPIELNRPQLLFLDAIRFSIEMASFSQLRLLATLAKISEKRDGLSDEEKMLDQISALQDAWNIVDSSFRLRCLVGSVPYMKKNTPAVQSFVRATAQVPAMRNLIQHLDTEMKQLIEGDHSAWGSLCWAVVTDAKNCIIESWQFIPGTSFSGDKPHIVNPLGRLFKREIDHIELHAGEHRLSLSDVMEAIRFFGERLEDALVGHFDGKHTSISDVLMAVTFQGNKPNNALD